MRAGHREVVGEPNPAELHFKQRETPTRGELGVPGFFGLRLRISMTRAQVEDGMGGRGRPLVGGLVHWHRGCQEEFRLRA